MYLSLRNQCAFGAYAVQRTFDPFSIHPVAVVPNHLKPYRTCSGLVSNHWGTPSKPLPNSFQPCLSHSKCTLDLSSEHSICMQNAFQEHSKCIPKAVQVHSKCIPDRSKCIPRAFQMHSKSAPSAFQMHSRPCQMHSQSTLDLS